MVLLLVFLVSLIPLVSLLLWLIGRRKGDAEYKKLCRRALGRGMLCILPLTPMCAVCHILLNLTGIRETHPVLHQALFDFIVLALMEEIVKTAAARKLLRKTEYPYSWVDTVCLFTIAAIGFSLLEAAVYAIGASVPVILVRGISFPHAGLGYITGYFYGKGIREEKPAVKWIGFVIAWFLHGLYDFSLSEVFLEINDNLVFVPFILVLIDIILVVRIVRFVKKSRNRPECTEPLVPQQITETVS